MPAQDFPDSVRSHAMRLSTLKPSRSAPGQRAGPQSVGRIFTILDSIAGTRAGATLSDLARITDSPKTSLVGLLAGLTGEGCLVRDEVGRYFLGPRIHALAMQAMAGRELAALVRPVLVRLVEASGETAVLGALAPDAEMSIYLDKVESSSSIRYAVTAGERRDLYCTAMGKALLAHFDPARLRQYLKSTTRKKFTANTIINASDLLAELSRVKRAGIARSNGERVNGASALAAPIFAGDGSVVAAVLIAGPSERMRASARRHEQLLKHAAAECTRLAGGAVPTQPAGKVGKNANGRRPPAATTRGRKPRQAGAVAQENGSHTAAPAGNHWADALNQRGKPGTAGLRALKEAIT